MGKSDFRCTFAYEARESKFVKCFISKGRHVPTFHIYIVNGPWFSGTFRSTFLGPSLDVRGETGEKQNI